MNADRGEKTDHDHERVDGCCVSRNEIRVTMAPQFSTGSGSDRAKSHNSPVATAPGTVLILGGTVTEPVRILYCHCKYAQVVPADVKGEVLERLASSGLAFDAVPDLCEMSARRDPKLKELAAGAVKIAACYPRAVKWLFAAAGAQLPTEGVEILNMRVDPAATIVQALLPAEDGVKEKL